MRASPLLLLLLAGCAAQSGPAAGGGGDPSCADANDLLAACAEDESMCGEALGVLAERCSGGKADGIELRGVQVTRVGGRTYFKMPLAYLPVEDRRRLQDEMITPAAALPGAALLPSSSRASR